MLLGIIASLITIIYTQPKCTVNSQEDEPEKRKRYVTCDFDLLEDEINADIVNVILSELPEVCQQIYYSEEDLRDEMITESYKFKEFMVELETIEKIKDPNYDDIPTKDWELRNKIYIAAELHKCSMQGSEEEEVTEEEEETEEETEEEIDKEITYNDFINCIIHRRELTTEEIKM